MNLNFNIQKKIIAIKLKAIKNKFMLNWLAPDLITTGTGSELQPSVTQHTPLFTQKAVIIRS